MKENKKVIKNGKRGSMMLESMVLLVVGLLVLIGFLSFLGEGEQFAINSLDRIDEVSSEGETGLGTFKRIE